MNDQELRTERDYEEARKEAAHRVIMELANLFKTYEGEIVLIGGWVPGLMFMNEGHVGSVDVDFMLNHLKLKEENYLGIAKILLRNGYYRHPSKYFTFVKKVSVDGKEYDVDVDFLAGMYGGTDYLKRSQHVQGVRALKASGGNFAFEFPPQKVMIEGARPDGALDSASINVVAVVPYLVMKTLALGRGKAKDAYDIYFVVSHYSDGPKKLGEEFQPFKEKKLVKEMKEKLGQKFASVNHSGPQDIVDFMSLDDERDIERIKRLSCRLIQEFLENI